MFQFYLSSIKSPRKFILFEKDRSFNSTLVQLKGFSLVAYLQPLRCFNSTLVQLKDLTDMHLK